MMNHDQKSMSEPIAPGPLPSSGHPVETPATPNHSPPPIKSPPTKPAKHTAPQHQDGFRELIETVVFVVVLVLILKTFLAEAFVIPTGSMATTLLGYHREVVCEKCSYRFLVNASSEADPSERQPQPVVGAFCENCQYFNDFRPQVPPGPFR